MLPSRRASGPKKQRKHSSGKKKRHTHTAQVVAERKSTRLLATAFGSGRALFKRSKTGWLPSIVGLWDSGFEGLARLPANSKTPPTRCTGRPLTKDEKAAKREWARERIVAAPVIGSLKGFGILSERYRNRRKRFGLRFNLIAAIDNDELDRRAK